MGAQHAPCRRTQANGGPETRENCMHCERIPRLFARWRYHIGRQMGVARGRKATQNRPTHRDRRGRWYPIPLNSGRAENSANCGRETFRSFLKNEHHQTDETRVGCSETRDPFPTTPGSRGDGGDPTPRTRVLPGCCSEPPTPVLGPRGGARIKRAGGVNSIGS